MRYVTLLLGMLGMIAYASAPTLTPQSFIEGIPVRTAGEMPVQVLELPLSVYRTVQRPDLGDLRVFDADGQEVPYALLRNDLRPAQTRTTPLRFFRLEGEVVPETLRLRLEQEGTTLDLSAPATAVTQPPAYLLHTSELEGVMTELRLEWADTGQNKDRVSDFLTTLSVEVSDDLQAWRPLSTASLARLERDGNRLERNVIPLPPTTASYLRLTSLEGALPPLTGVQALTQTEAVRGPLETLTLAPRQSDEEGRYTFNAAAFLPVSSAQLLLPQPNTLVRTELLSSTSSEEPWTRRYTGLRYRVVQEEQDLTSPPMTFAPTTDRYWQVRTARAGGGVGQGELRLKLRYHPHTLLFLARGEGPYMLAYGSPTATSAAFEPSELAQIPADMTLAGLPRARAEPPVTLAGTSLLGETRSFPWSQVLLWSVLVLGVGLLGWLAFGLLRQLDRGEEV